jgi:putative transport protein
VGWFAPKAAPPTVLGTFGLALFLYAVGIQYGKQFFAGLTSADGLKANVAALAGVATAGALCLLFVHTMGISVGHALGLFAGSGTSTPTLQAAIDRLQSGDPAVGYSVSYPFGVAGPILFLYFTSRMSKQRAEAPSAAGMELLEVAVRRPEHFGRRLADVTGGLPADVRIVAVRRDGRNRPATPDVVLAEHDVLLAVAPTSAILDEVRAALGESAPGHITQDRRDLDYLRVFASRPTVAGRTLGDLTLPSDGATVIQVRRGDADLLPRPDLILEFGDRVGLLAPRTDFPALRQYFGDSIKGTAEFSYVSIGLGMALGFLVGAINIPLPGVGPITLGMSGVLIVALVLGRSRRTAGLNWTLPASANHVLRNLGTTVFLAQVGLASGPKFAEGVLETGPLLLGLGVIVLIGLVLPVLLLSLFVFRLPFDDVAGIVAGATGNAAIVAFANKIVPNDRPDVGFATIFPGMTVVKILFVSIVPSLL